MEKKQYHSPAIRVVKMQVQQMLAGSNGNSVNSIGGTAGLNLGGAGNGDALSNGFRGFWGNGWE